MQITLCTPPLVRPEAFWGIWTFVHANIWNCHDLEAGLVACSWRLHATVRLSRSTLSLPSCDASGRFPLASRGSAAMRRQPSTGAFARRRGIERKRFEVSQHCRSPHNLVDKTRYSHGPRLVKTELTNAQRTSAQKSLVQAYLSTVNGLGVETWLMHDGLLGWWWGKHVGSSLLSRARRFES